MARRGGIDDDDLRLWALVAREVEPLKTTEERLKEAARKAALTAEREPKAAAPPPRPTPARGPAKPAAAPPPPVAERPQDRRGRVAGIDRRTAERLRKGQFPVEARLDLHGMTQAEAHRALGLFVRQCHAARKRCLLVITGKGSRRRDLADGPFASAEPPGVLKRAVPQWLQEPDLAGLVLTTSRATPAHGGGGAMYVLLKRRRES